MYLANFILFHVTTEMSSPHIRNWCFVILQTFPLSPSVRLSFILSNSFVVFCPLFFLLTVCNFFIKTQWADLSVIPLNAVGVGKVEIPDKQPFISLNSGWGHCATKHIPIDIIFWNYLCVYVT